MAPLKIFISRIFPPDFSSLVFIFSALTFLCVFFYTFHPSYTLNFHALYAAGITLAAFLSSAGSFFVTNNRNEPRLSRQEIALVVVLFLFGLALGLYRLDYFSIWLDEEVQAFSTREWPGLSIVRRAATSQQMPLGYYFTALNWDLVGNKEWGLRLLPCLFTAASGVLFFRLARAVCKNPLIYAISPFVYFLNPWIIRYAQEGRPYGLILFCGLLWLNSVHYLISGSAKSSDLLRGTLLVFCCTLLFLMSASLQPLILCASFLCVLSFLLFLPYQRKQVGAFYGSVLLAIFVIAPLFQLTRESSAHYLFSISSTPPWQRIMQGLQSLPEHASHLFLGQAYFLALVYLFSPLALFRPEKKNSGSLWIGLGGCLAFGILFLSVFSTLINYPVFVRYFIVLYPLGLLVIITYFDRLSGEFENDRNRYFKWGWQLIFLAALAAPSVRAMPDVYYAKKFDRWNIDFKSIYYFFRQTGIEGDLGYVIPFGLPQNWEQNGFLATDYYYEDNFPVRVTSFRRVAPNETAAELILKDLTGLPPHQVYLTFLDPQEPANTSLSQYCGTQPDVDVREGDLFLVCKLLVKDSLAKTLDRFFAGLVKTVKEKERAYRIYDILLHLAESEKNPLKCRAYLSELKKLKSDSEVVRALVQNHETKCASISAPARKKQDR